MLRKTIIILFASLSLINFKVRADEGMWLPLLVERLNYVDMQKMGCHLTAEEIYSANHSSLKDVTTALNSPSMGNSFCTGVMVSNEGLMFANHHCAISSLQDHSTVEKDLLVNGFWALNKVEELKTDKISITFLEYIEDVSGRILPYLNKKMTEAKRKIVVDSLSAVIEKRAVDGTMFSGKVLPFFDGNEFYLFVTKTYKDVRLVGAPPEAIARFGGNSDNWQWPRECGDFSLFRVYTAPDGSPAEYSKKNIPLVPKKFLPISLKGVKKDDFTMVIGMPGSTNRFNTSYSVKYNLDIYNPSVIKIREKILSLMDEDMKANDEVQVQYYAKYFMISNYYIFYKAQSETLEKLKVYDQKVKNENDFQAWCNSNPEKKELYGNVLNETEKIFEKISKYYKPYLYFTEGISGKIDLFVLANNYNELYKQLKSGANQDSITKLCQMLTYSTKQHFKNYNLSTDKKICTALMEMFYADISKEFHPDIYNTIQNKYNGSIKDYVNDLYEKSIFASKDKMLEFLAKPDFKKIDKDMGFIAMTSINNKKEECMNLFLQSKIGLSDNSRLYVKGQMEMYKDKKFYPNANGTMRLTYGKVSDYSPSPDKKYPYYTTLSDLMAKENPKLFDYQVPVKLKDFYKNKDYGKYGTDGDLRVCFLTNNDITGGVSGAPVINGDGELVGLTFDINWEASASPMLYNQNYQRTICVDIRYVLFMIDKYCGASNIINELSIK